MRDMRAMPDARAQMVRRGGCMMKTYCLERANIFIGGVQQRYKNSRVIAREIRDSRRVLAFSASRIPNVGALMKKYAENDKHFRWRAPQ